MCKYPCAGDNNATLLMLLHLGAVHGSRGHRHRQCPYISEHQVTLMSSSALFGHGKSLSGHRTHSRHCRTARMLMYGFKGRNSHGRQRQNRGTPGHRFYKRPCIHTLTLPVTGYSDITVQSCMTVPTHELISELPPLLAPLYSGMGTITLQGIQKSVSGLHAASSRTVRLCRVLS